MKQRGVRKPLKSKADEAQLGFVAELLAERSREIGAGAAGRLAGQGVVGNASDRVLWSQSLAARAIDLSGAIGAGRPELFAAQVAWSAVALRVRGLEMGPLVQGLACLRDEVLAMVAPEDRGLIETYLGAARERLAAGVEEPPSELSVGTPAGALASRYLLHILEGNRREACAVVTRAVVDGRLTVRSAYRDVFTPVLREVGRLWHVGDITVAEEHFVTATTMMSMSQVLPMAPPAASSGRTLVAGSVSGNHHEVGARMVADSFEMQGWRAVYLGANVPAEDFAGAAADFGADAAALSVALPGQLRELRVSADALRRARPGILIVAGGAAFGLAGGGAPGALQLGKEHGADVVGRDAEESHRMLMAVLEPSSGR